MEQGLVHLYWGDGKGKTSAAMGLALRACGAGKRVLVLQFLKGMPTSEIAPLGQLGVKVIRAQQTSKFTFQMSEQEKQQVKEENNLALVRACAQNADVLVLDEACAAFALGLVDQALLRKAVLEKPIAQEVVLTGRDPALWMRDAADYSTELQCHRHPYDAGIAARRGIDF